MKILLNFIVLLISLLSCREKMLKKRIDPDRINYENVLQELDDTSCILESGLTKELFDDFANTIKTELSVKESEKIILLFYILNSETTKLVQKCIMVSNTGKIQEYHVKQNTLQLSNTLNEIDNLYKEIEQTKTKDRIIPNRLLVVEIDSSTTCQLYGSLEINKLEIVKF